jgi:oligopeptide transport system permease protein
MAEAATVPVEPVEAGSSLWSDAWRRLKKNRAATVAAGILLAMLLGCIFVPELSQWDYTKTDLGVGPQPPSWAHWMGTDYHGRDLLVRVFIGGRVSFAVGFIATIVSFVIGVTWGGVAGYAGGRTDGVMMRIVDVMYTFPFLIFVILMQVYFANKGGVFHEAFMTVVSPFADDPKDALWFSVFQICFEFIALGAISWLTMARIVRGQVLTIREQPYVEAARSVGVGHAGILFRHILPNALGPIIVYTTLTVPQIMLVEAFLSFLGLGTQEPLSSWGLLAAGGAEVMVVYWWILLFPALMLAVTLFCLNFVGDGLRDALDPKIRK